MTVTTLTITTTDGLKETSRVYHYSTPAKAVNGLMLLNESEAYTLNVYDNGKVSRVDWNQKNILSELKDDGMAFAYSEGFEERYVAYRYELQIHEVK